MATLKVLPESFLRKGRRVKYIDGTFTFLRAKREETLSLSDIQAMSRRRADSIETSTDTNVFKYFKYISYWPISLFAAFFGIKNAQEKKYAMMIVFSNNDILRVKADHKTYQDIQDAFVDSAKEIQTTDRLIKRLR